MPSNSGRLLDHWRRIVFRWSSLALLLTIAAAVWRDAILTMRFPAALGIDGYYYVLQISTFAAHRHFYFPTRTPLVLLLLTLVNLFASDPVLAAKIGSLILNTSLCLAVFALISSVTRKVWLGVLGVSLLIIPQAHFFMTTEYLSQLGAVGFLVWAGWATFRANRNGRRTSWLLGATFIVAAVLSHRSALFLAIGIAICYVAVTALNYGTKWRAGVLALVLVIWFAPAIVSLQPVFPLPEWLQNQIGVRPRWPMEFILFPDEAMLALSALMLLGFALWLAAKGKKDQVVSVFGAPALFSILVTLNPFLNAEVLLSSLAGRLRVLSYIQVALLLPVVAGLVYSRRKHVAIYLAGLFLPLLVLSAVASKPHGIRSQFLTRRLALIEGLGSFQQKLGTKPLVIAPHGDQFVVTAITGVPSQQRAPAEPSFDKVYWLLSDVSDPNLRSVSQIIFENNTTQAVMVEDAFLRQRWDTMATAGRKQLLRTNPNLKRNFDRAQTGLELE